MAEAIRSVQYNLDYEALAKRTEAGRGLEGDAQDKRALLSYGSFSNYGGSGVLDIPTSLHDLSLNSTRLLLTATGGEEVVVTRRSSSSLSSSSSTFYSSSSAGRAYVTSFSPSIQAASSLSETTTLTATSSSSFSSSPSSTATHTSSRPLPPSSPSCWSFQRLQSGGNGVFSGLYKFLCSGVSRHEVCQHEVSKLDAESILVQVDDVLVCETLHEYPQAENSYNILNYTHSKVPQVRG